MSPRATLTGPVVEPRGMPDHCTAPCTPPCENPPAAEGLCSSHYRRKLRGKPIDTPLRNRDPLEDYPLKISTEQRELIEADARENEVTGRDVVRAALMAWGELSADARAAYIARRGEQLAPDQAAKPKATKGPSSPSRAAKKGRAKA